MKTNSVSIKSRCKSFSYAIQGIGNFFKQEPNARIHLVATIVVIAGILCFKVSKIETVILVLSIGFVWVSEIFNTAIEEIVNFISPGYHPKAKLIKDISAGAVMLSAFTASITGIIVFLPKFF